MVGFTEVSPLSQLIFQIAKLTTTVWSLVKYAFHNPVFRLI